MHIDEPAILAPAREETQQAPEELVMGLHWTPAVSGAQDQDPANLDAVCVLLDERHQLLEIVHPGRPRNANDSVLHTGDSRNGASAWDDERIFVFLEALPQAVHAVLFGVVSVDGRELSRVPGASCHLSDRADERELIRIELSGVARDSAHTVAIAQRSGADWKLIPLSHAPEWAHHYVRGAERRQRGPLP
jgi:stress response protein SCP2